MAQYFVDIFAESLIIEPLKNHPCEVNCPLPSPNDLRNKILIKNKKLPVETPSKINNQNVQTLPRKPDSISSSSSCGPSTDLSNVASSPLPSCQKTPSDESLRRRQPVIEKISSGNNPRYGIVVDDDEVSDEEVQFNTVNPTEIQAVNIDVPRETKATKAMSDLVHYTVPIRFKTFVQADERNRSFEMSSFSEDKGQSLIRDYAKEFLVYNQRQLSRIYPRGTRFESSNYSPYFFWPIGCQMVALNYQTLGMNKD